MTDRLSFIDIWTAIGGHESADIGMTGPEDILPSIYDVAGLAAYTVGCATLAAAQIQALRSGTPVARVRVDRRAAALAFAGELLFEPVGWASPAIWDPIAGDYPTSDGWIRLHTNYAHHRRAVEQVVGVLPSREAVAAEVLRRSADDLETEVVRAGGCAAALHDLATWRAMPAGAAATAEPLTRWDTRPATPDAALATALDRPYAGVRVLDLTRVLAGPVATRFLAAYGADVLRIDPRGFEEVPAIVPEMSVGKRCAALDLTAAHDRAIFERLVAEAHIMVSGFRPGALAGLGFDQTALEALNPALITVSHSAYGWSGPWRERRGFDSLVQMSCGIAAAGRTATGADRPVPLPVQALDHGTGYLIAAVAGLALRRLLADGLATEARLSLAGTANVLMRSATPEAIGLPRPEVRDGDRQEVDTAWGPARQIRVPGRIDGIVPRWTITAGPLGRHEPTWSGPTG